VLFRSAVEVLRRARSLRDANSPRVESVYINADLTPTEAKLAFEERVRRRARGNKSQPPRKGASAMDVVEDTDAGTNVAGGRVHLPMLSHMTDVSQVSAQRTNL